MELSLFYIGNGFKALLVKYVSCRDSSPIFDVGQEGGIGGRPIPCIVTPLLFG